MKGESEFELDEKKIQDAEKWDGIHGVITNCKEIQAKEVLKQYKGLWQVEESFRISKHDLKVRPVYHWTPSRIRAHLAICYMAFSCVRHLEYRTCLQYKKLSPEAIRRSLTRVQVSILKHSDGKRYALPSEATQEARKLYHIMGKKYSTIPYQLY